MGYENSKTIYIVVSQTGTILSRLLRLFTKAEYNHVSIALDENLDHMYSFGRTNPYNPIIGGFVSESPKFGTFKRFYKTRVVILSVVITIEQFNKLKSCMEHMFEKKNKYKYNYLGLLLAGAHINYRSVRRYYCSEFAKEMLTRFGIITEEMLPKIVKPIDFLCLGNITNCKVIYRGNLQEYALINTDALCEEISEDYNGK